MKSKIILFLIFASFSCFSQTQSDLLKKSYDKNSLEGLHEFLDNWNREIVPVSYSYLGNLKRIACEIYTEFYNPFSLYKIGLDQQTENRLDWVKYVIIQNRLDIYQLNIDSLNIDFFAKPEDSLLITSDSIIDFRPTIEFNDIKNLYLTKEYENILLDFLGDSHRPLGSGGIMNPARSRGNTQKKQEFLNRVLLIIYGHWGGYWHLETHPDIFSITLNKSKTLAIVKYRLGYQGGDAYYKLNGNKWVFLSGGLTWIE